MGGGILLGIALGVFIAALIGRNKIKIVLAALFLIFAIVLVIGGAYLRYQVELRG